MSIGKPLGGAVVAAAGLLTASMMTGAPVADADQTAYLVNVHVRPGYNFPNAEAALGYGYTVCDRVASGMDYAQLIDEVNAHFHTTAYDQGAYLVNQAVNELCPAQISPLRQSAAGFTLPA